MTYVTADLHGWPLEDFQKLLDRAGFGEDDFLYVLGDVIDRGDYGTELLLWLTEQPNVQLILGNHEAMLLSCDFLFQEVTDESLAWLDSGAMPMQLFSTWMQNGGAPTLGGLRRLLKDQPELLEGILDYLRDAPLYEWVEAGGRDFLLVHGGLENFSPDRELEDYDPHDLLWARPTPDTRYSDRFFTVLGHTPTVYLDPAYDGRAYRTDTWICIDMGCPDQSPMLLRLDDMKEFY